MPIARRLASTLAATVLAAGGVVATTALASSPADAAGSCVSYNYSQGGTSTCISYIQQMVNWQNNAYGVSAPHLAIDGAFGPQTKAAVVAFQRNRGLTADGIVGPQTWRALCGVAVGGFESQAAFAAWLRGTGYPVAAHNAAGCSPAFPS